MEKIVFWDQQFLLMTANKRLKPLKTSFYSSFLFVLFLWGIHLINYNLPFLNLSTYGILPRDASGLRGILFSPLLHSTKDFGHLINNSGPLLVLLGMVLLLYKRLSLFIVGFIWFASGLFTWCLARESYHIGASGVIYGLAFFLFFSGVFVKSIRLIAISLIVVFLYGSMVWGLFPGQPGVSFEGHIAGAVAGVMMAYYCKDKGPQKKKYNLNVRPEFDEFVNEYNFLWRQEEAQKQLETKSKEIEKKDAIDRFFDRLKGKD